jgi:hypothetical protein
MDSHLLFQTIGVYKNVEVAAAAVTAAVVAAYAAAAAAAYALNCLNA